MSFKFGKNGGGKTVPHVSHLIDIATDANSQGSENWTLFMEICDVVNSSEEGPKDAVKAIRKKFATKNPPTINLSLSVLEACVKNCGKRFHIHIATKDFLQDFIKIISPKHSPPIELQMRVLGLLQTWAHVFQSFPELKEVCRHYQELRNKGVEFPPLDVEKANQAYIPSKSAPTIAVTDLRTSNLRTRSTLSPTVPQYKASAGGTRLPGEGGGALTPDHLSKLHSELNTVQQNCRVFGEMLTDLTPGQENKADVELLEDLNMTCRQMQKRIMELIQMIQVEQVTEELLRVNDELNNVFLRYDRYQRMRSSHSSSGQTPQSIGGGFPPPAAHPTPTPAATSYPPASGGVAIDNLIDFGDTPSPKPALPYPGLESQFDNMALHAGSNRAAHDEFGLLGASSGSAPGRDASQVVPETDFDEMEKWLMAGGGKTEGKTEGTTSQEFEQFLFERAKEVDRVPAGHGGASGQRAATAKKDDDAALFSL